MLTSDDHWILVDVFDIPNLHRMGLQTMKYAGLAFIGKVKLKRSGRF